MAITRRKSLTLAHGYRRDDADGVWLTKAGKQALTDAYEKRMLQKIGGALPDFTGSLRRHVYRQAQRVAAYMSDSSQLWTGMSWR